MSNTSALRQYVKSSVQWTGRRSRLLSTCSHQPAARHAVGSRRAAVMSQRQDLLSPAVSSLSSSLSPSLSSSSSSSSSSVFPNTARWLSAASSPDNNASTKDDSQKKKNENADDTTTKKETLEETIRRISNEKNHGTNTNTNTTTTGADAGGGFGVDQILRTVAETWFVAQDEVKKTWSAIVEDFRPKGINKKIRTVTPDANATSTPEEDQVYTGSVAIMVIDESEHLTPWQRMQRRLADAPMIQSILEKSNQAYEQTGAKAAKQKLDDLAEDAREAWETSQSPWVYRVSNVYDTITAGTPESNAIRELRKLDPEFTIDGWQQDLVDYTLPQLMTWILEGRLSLLKPWLSESVFQRIAQDVAARQQDDVELDTHILGITRSQVVAIDPDEVNGGSPIIVLVYICDHVYCARRKDDGTIVEGSASSIQSHSYVAAFQREYHADKGELNWKIVDFRCNGVVNWLEG